MPAGKLRHRITIEQPTDEQGATYGEHLQEAWTEFATVWARVSPLTGRERLDADLVAAEMSHEVEMRYLAGVTEKMRVNFGGRILNILSVKNVDERNIMLLLQCVEQK